MDPNRVELLWVGFALLCSALGVLGHLSAQSALVLIAATLVVFSWTDRVRDGDH